MSLSHTQERAQGGKGVCPPPLRNSSYWDCPPPPPKNCPPPEQFWGGVQKNLGKCPPLPPIESGAANIFFNIFT